MKKLAILVMLLTSCFFVSGSLLAKEPPDIGDNDFVGPDVTPMPYVKELPDPADFVGPVVTPMPDPDMGDKIPEDPILIIEPDPYPNEFIGHNTIDSWNVKLDDAYSAPLRTYNDGYGLGLSVGSRFGRGINVFAEQTGIHVFTRDNNYCALYAQGNVYIRGQLVVDGTENLALKARVKASSEYNEHYSASKVNDGIYGRWDEGEWASNGEKEGACIELQWWRDGYHGEEVYPQTFNKIDLFGRVNKYDQIKDGWLVIRHKDDLLGEETRIHLGLFPVGGVPKEILLSEEEGKDIVSIKVCITETSDSTMNTGLSEIQCVYDANLWDHTRFRYYQ